MSMSEELASELNEIVMRKTEALGDEEYLETLRDLVSQLEAAIEAKEEEMEG